MSEKKGEELGFNRRDFLRGGSVATLMTVLGGVELFGQTNAPSAEEGKAVAKTNVGVIGLGAWGREIVTTLGRLPNANVVAVCDTYPASLRRGGNAAPGAVTTPDYKTILANKDIRGVIIATPTHKHKEIALEALKAGKHVYCEAPIAGSIEDARAIAEAAQAVTKQRIFQAGLQKRSDPQRLFVLTFVRSGALGKPLLGRAQWHKKTSWRSASPNPEHEKALNWRLDKTTSLGLVGEIGIHPIDQACLFLNGLPQAVTGFGSVMFWKDGRDVPDTVQAVLEFPNGVQMIYDATLANSFDNDYEMFYGSDAAVMMRESKAWMFKEVDSPLYGWEVYATKTTFYKDTGITLIAGASKVPPGADAAKIAEEEAAIKTPLWRALDNFLRNAADLDATAEDYKASYGADDVDGLMEALAKVKRRDAADHVDGFKAVVIAAKANEAILNHTRVEIKPELFELPGLAKS